MQSACCSATRVATYRPMKFLMGKPPMIWAVVGIATLLVLIWAIHWSTGLCWPTGQARPAPRSSRWRRDWRKTVAPGLFLVAGVVLVTALMIDCRYSCQQWLSTVLDILATFASFLMGMVLTRVIDIGAMSRKNVMKAALWFIFLLVFATVVILSPLSASTPNSTALFIWALVLPVLGSAAKRLWPWLF